MRRPIARAAVGAATVVLLAACAEPLPEPTPDALPAVAPPVVDVEQVERALDDLGAILSAADEEGDPDALAPRVAGAAANTRQAQYTLAAAGIENAVTEIPTAVQTVATPVVEGWPRTVMAVTEPPEDLQAPLMLTLVQEEPRRQYSLRTWVRLFPETSTPPIAQPEIGSPTAEGLDLAVPLDELLPRYLDVVRSGTDSEHAETFAEDPLRSGIRGLLNTYEGLTPETGSSVETYTPVEGSLHALATVDGGAVVTAAFTTLTEIELDDSTLTLGATAAAFLDGETAFEESLEIRWRSMVAFHVPPAGSDEPVQVLGGEHVQSGAEGS